MLFYFAASAFCAPGSRNQTLITQYGNDPSLVQRYLATKEKFEAALSERPGLQYVVDHDAKTAQRQFIGPNGPQYSDFWVIRAQKRETLQDDFEIIGYYYIFNSAIFPAPSVASILQHRILNCLQGADQLVKTTADLPLFSVSTGYTYFPPNQQSTTVAESTRGSRAGTPLPEAALSNKQDVTGGDDEDDQSNEAILRNALRKAMNFGGHFYDDAPLVGEPGNFRFTTRRDPIQNVKATEGLLKASSRASTPLPSSQVIKPSSTPVSPTGSAKGDPTVNIARPNPRRKKSMAANDNS